MAGVSYLKLLSENDAARHDAPVEAAFRAHARYAHAIAFRILGQEADADDVLQDIFIIAQRRLRDLSNPAAVRRWFAVATVRLARRRLKRRKWLVFLGLDESQSFDHVAASGASPEQSALLSSIYSMLAKLPTGARVAWTLRYLEGMSLDMVAEACNCSLATAKRRILAAQQFLAEVVEHE